MSKKMNFLQKKKLKIQTGIVNATMLSKGKNFKKGFVLEPHHVDVVGLISINKKATLSIVALEKINDKLVISKVLKSYDSKDILENIFRMLAQNGFVNLDNLTNENTGGENE